MTQQNVESKEKRKVSEHEFNQAYENIDNKKIIGSVIRKYRNRLDDDSLRYCGLNGLWRCLRHHDDSYGTKFTSSLWRFVTWECERELQNLRKKKDNPVELFDIPVEEVESLTIFDDLETIIGSEDATIIRMKYIENNTLKEIGAHFGFTKEAARQRIRKALIKIKSVYNKSEGIGVSK